MKNNAIGVFATASVLALVACGGGGTSSTSIPAANPIAPASAAPGPATQSLAVTFTGIAPQSGARSTKSFSDTPLTVTYNGATVGTGVLDANGHASITFTQALPAGSVVKITAGAFSATVVLATAVTATAVQVTVNPDGTLTVLSSGDPNKTGKPDPNAADAENETEDSSGNVTGVSNGNGKALPPNLPFSLTNACGTITITPTNPADATLHFSERSSDQNDEDQRTKYEGPFTKALTFPTFAGDARLHILVFDASGKLLVEVKAPIDAFTAGATASPAPCDSASPSASAQPSSAPSVTPSAAASASPSPAPSAGASASPSAAPSASALPSAAPSAAASASAAPSAAPSTSASPAPSTSP